MTTEPIVGSRPNAATSDRVTGVIIAALIIIAFSLVGRQLYRVASGPVPPTVGDSAPAFVASSLDGKATKLVDLRGKVVLIDFWATWCPPCVASMPHLQKVYDEYKGRGFVVVGLNQEPHDLGRVRAYVRNQRFTFPMLVDEGEIARRYGVYSFPTSVLIDRSGVVRQLYRGPVPQATLHAVVGDLVGKGEQAAR